jgi:hypothetical protein
MAAALLESEAVLTFGLHGGTFGPAAHIRIGEALS